MLAIDPHSTMPALPGNRNMPAPPLGDAFRAFMALTESPGEAMRPGEKTSPPEGKDKRARGANDDDSDRKDGGIGLPPVPERQDARAAAPPVRQGDDTRAPRPPHGASQAAGSLAAGGRADDSPDAAATPESPDDAPPATKPASAVATEVTNQGIDEDPASGTETARRNGTAARSAAPAPAPAAVEGEGFQALRPDEKRTREGQARADRLSEPTASTAQAAIGTPPSGAPVASVLPPSPSAAGKTLGNNPTPGEPSSDETDPADPMSARPQANDATIAFALQAAPDRGPSHGRAGAALLRPPSHAGHDGDQSEARIRIDGDTAHVRLHSRELGAVAITLQRDSSAVSVHVHTDRSESGEVMRRHADVLERELRDSNSTMSRLSFSDGQGGNGGSGSGQYMLSPESSVTAAEDDTSPRHESSRTPEASQALASGRLDVRL